MTALWYSGPALDGTSQHITERPAFEDETENVVYATGPESDGEATVEDVPVLEKPDEVDRRRPVVASTRLTFANSFFRLLDLLALRLVVLCSVGTLEGDLRRLEEVDRAVGGGVEFDPGLAVLQDDRIRSSKSRPIPARSSTTTAWTDRSRTRWYIVRLTSKPGCTPRCSGFPRDQGRARQSRFRRSMSAGQIKFESSESHV